jgi:chromosome partitioning protein
MCPSCGDELPNSTRGDLVGISEIAEMANVTRAAVTNWRNRKPDFPKPVTELASGPIFEKEKIKQWLQDNPPRRKD